MKIKTTLLLTLILLVVCTVPPVQAQTAVDRLPAVQIDLWPDYDQPAVLVLITAELPADVVLPAAVRLLLPGTVDQPSAVARVTATGEMLNTPFETASTAEGLELVIETTERVIRVEYYLPYNRAGDVVDFDFAWLGGVSVDALAVLFQQPSLATKVALDDQFVDVGIQSDGRQYFRWDVGALAVNETRSAALEYVAPLPQLNAPAPSLDEPQAKDQPLNTWALVLAVAGGLLIGGALGWWGGNQRRPVRRSRPVSRAAYCRQCGAELMRGDRFCRQCGARNE